MLIHHFHGDNGAYLGSSSAAPNPLEPGQFLVPAHATAVAPPAVTQGFLRVFRNGAWGYVPAEDLDVAPSPEPTVTSSMVNAERDRRINAGVMFQGVIYDTDAAARENIAGASTAALEAIMDGVEAGDMLWHGGPDPFMWIAKDNSTRQMDAETMFAFGKTVMAHKQRLIFAARALKDSQPIPADYATNDSYW